MAKKGSKKRKAPSDGGPAANHPNPPANKRQKPSQTNNTSTQWRHPVLSQHYNTVLTLRQYVLKSLPSSSRLRRKKIRNIGPAATEEKPVSEIEQSVVKLLDNSYVALNGHVSPLKEGDKNGEVRQKWVAFTQTQRQDDSRVSLGDATMSCICMQSEIVDFVVWLIFSRTKESDRPQHLLCDGFRRGTGHHNLRNQCSIPGLFSAFPNNNVQVLKDSPWPQLLTLLGNSGQRLMIDLLVGCSVFVPVAAGHGNLLQITGTPIFEISHEPEPEPESSVRKSNGKQQPARKNRRENDTLAHPRLPSEISFIRSRMMYARPALNSKGLVSFGLRHIHVLNRCPFISLDAAAEDEALSKKKDENTLKVMMYIFPRQFSLHNVFTSMVDFKKTSQKLMDYTMREEEIVKMFGVGGGGKCGGNKGVNLRAKIPKRLRGQTKELVEKLQKLHGRCSYSSILQHYCPVPSVISDQVNSPVGDTSVINLRKAQSRAGSKKKGRKSLQEKPKPEINLDGVALPDLATPASRVSAFCQAVAQKLIPNQLWGVGQAGARNQEVFLKQVDHFVKLRRFESLSLHEVVQNIQVSSLEWLSPPSLRGVRSSATDTQKRHEILNEFLYYLFDSLLIPLIRSNFYVTESNAHRHKIFFFRHDVWKYVAEPAMRGLKDRMFEEVRLGEAMRILEGRKMKFSQVRLLPKVPAAAVGVLGGSGESAGGSGSGGIQMRPITNLRRKQPINKRGNLLGPSINTILTPVQVVLRHERLNLRLEQMQHPSLLGSSMFSVGDMYSRVKSFRSQLQPGTRLFFAKVDVQAAFDMIPQDAVIKLMAGKVMSSGQYDVAKYVEVKPSVAAMDRASGTSVSKPKGPPPRVPRRWQARAMAPGDGSSLLDALSHSRSSEDTGEGRGSRGIARNKSGTIFVDTAPRKAYSRHELCALMASHIKQNMVKVGKKFYRQKEGIPQGSVLSSVLCNYFYADLEGMYLGFVHENGGTDKTGKGGKMSLLLRLIDDFLLITTDKETAGRFVRTMHAGVPEYGVRVSPGKTLVNFHLEVGGMTVKRIRKEETGFPYCGTLVDMKTLELVKDRGHVKDPGILPFNHLQFSPAGQGINSGGAMADISNALTVEYGRVPGQSFRRKVLNSFRIQAHAMFFDSSFNSSITLLSNLYSSFAECATKMWGYIKSMPKTKKPTAAFIIQTIEKLVEAAFAILTSAARREKKQDEGYVCNVGKTQVDWLAAKAFLGELGRRQSGFGEVIKWLAVWIERLEGNGKGKKGEVGGLRLERELKKIGGR
ncbi:hypothetical protein MKZ38_009438 [Zalerion maritima]|uniref:Telomerase reverse transcriptase n=1 Tax=Zalerion maritima TaxID=339359 RepID=A0AAD5RFZ0_9PEZI|nr:hypothetical protein MKZ38_009438 [Zalerion maritima]